MNAAFWGEGGYGAGASVIKSNSSHPDHVIVPDAQLLFTADFRRAGPDLVLTGQDGRHHIIPGYFSSEHRITLAAPNGASLSPDLVDLLAGSLAPNEYAQAGATTPADPIGKVEKVVGNVLVMRNGVAVTLNVGDAVYKSDVIQTSADSQVGISFPDGTALNLVANTRMALNEYSYDEHATSGNGALISLVEGSFSFVAGKVAHDGDMKIDTPIATMGIRGTTGWVQEQAVATVTATAGNETYTFAVVPDPGTGRVGQYDLIQRFVAPDGTVTYGSVIATVSQNGLVTTLSPNGVGQPPGVQTAPPTPAQAQFAATIVAPVVQIIINNQNNQNNQNGQGNQQQQQQQQPQQQDDQNNQQQTQQQGQTTQSTTSSTSSSGSSTSASDLNSTAASQLFTTASTTTTTVATDNGPQTVTFTVTPIGPTTTPASQQVNSTPPPSPPPPPTATPVAAWVSGNNNWNVPGNWSDDVVPTSQVVATIPAASPVVVTVDDQESASGLTIGAGDTLQVVGNTNSTPSSLTVSGAVDNFGIIQVNSTISDPTLTFQGPVTVESGGEIDAVGSGVTLYFLGGLDNSGSVTADQQGTISAQAIVIVNEASGQIIASNGGQIAIVDSQVTNDANGLIEATGAGSVISFASVQVALPLINAGTVEATLGGEVLISGIPVTNAGLFEADANSGVSFVGSTIDNSGGTLMSIAGGTIILSNSTINGGAVTNGGPLDIIGLSTLDGGVIVTGGQVTVEIGQILALDDATFTNTALTDNGTITVGGGIVDIAGAVTGTGLINIAAGTLEFGSTDTRAVTFTGSSGTLKLDIPVDFTVSSGGPGEVDGLVVGDIIDLKNTAVISAVINGSTLIVTEGDGTQLAYNVSGALTGNFFVVQGDNAGGDELVLSPSAAPTLTIANHTLTANEDGTVALGISETPVNPNDTVTVGISGIPSDATLSDSNGDTLTVVGGNITLTAAELAGLTLHAGDTNAVLTVTASNAAGGTSAPQTIGLTVTSAAPTLTIANHTLTANEDGTVALGISETPVNPNDTVTVGISGIPSDATLSDSNGDTLTVVGGNITLTAAELAGLTLHAGDTNAVLTVTASNAAGGTSAPQTIGLTVTSAAPTLTIANHTLTANEDGTVALGISETPVNPNDTVTVGISGIPSDATLSDSNGDTLTVVGGNITLTAAELAGLTLHAGDTNAVLTVTASNAAGGTSAPQTIGLTVTSAAPTLTIANHTLTANEDGTVALGISETPVNPNDTVTVGISGIPSDATLSDSNGDTLTVVGGNITLTAAELAGLTLHAGDTNAVLTVTASNAAGGTSAPQTIGLTVTSAAPTLTIANHTLTANEDGTVALGISETPVNPNDTVTVGISGIPSDATLSDSNGDTLTVVGGNITLTAAELAGLTLHAGDTNAVLTVTASNAAGGTSAPQTINLSTNPVAPILSVPNTLSVTAESSVALNITETPVNPNDSVLVTISGIPSDATLSDANHDTLTITGGSITLTPAELAGLTLNLGQTTTGTLAVTATNTLGATASVTDDITLTAGPAVSVSTAIVDNLPVQVGQTLVAEATILNDSADSGATIAYQWQSSSDGGVSWNNVNGGFVANFNGGLASFLQLTAAQQGEQFRVEASFTDSASQVITGTSSPTVEVSPITPVITAPFSVGVEELSIVKNGSEIYDDTFGQAPPESPTISSSAGPSPATFLTLGSTWTDTGGKAIMSSTGIAVNPVTAGVYDEYALLNTNTDPTSSSGLKEAAAFTVSATLDLVAGVPGNYGIELTDASSTNTPDQDVRLIVQGVNGGGTAIELVQSDPAAGTSIVLSSQTLTSAQLADNNEVQFQLAHAANTTSVTGAFTLLENGTATGATTTFTPTGTIFTTEGFTRVDIGAFVNAGVEVNFGAGQSVVEGQTLTASATTNDPNASAINYQWEKSGSSAFSSFVDIGTDSASYTVQVSDVGQFIRVVATTNDSSNPATATSAVTGAVVDTAVITENLTGTLSGNENSSISLAGLTVADSNPGDTLTTVLTVTSGSITAGGQTGATVTLSGTASAINTALSAATYTGNLNFHGADTLSATTTDGGGQTSGLKQFAITVADTGGITENLTGTLSGNENSSISLAGLTVADSNPGDTLTTVLTVTSGSITAGGQTGATVTLSGTASAINTALSAATYTGNLNFHGADTLSATTTDGGGQTSGLKQFAITVADTGGITENLTGTLSGNENSSISLAGLTVADSNPGDTLTTVLTVTSGSITAGGQTGATVTLSGTASAINTALSAATYTGNLNFHGADTLSATTTDGGGQTSGLKQFAITVADTGGITENLTGTLSGNENSSLSLAGLTVADSNPGDTLTTVLTVTSGSITAGGQTGATVTLSGTASAINTALSAATYTGNLNFHGADTLSATTTDGGGQTSGLKQFAITVADTGGITENLTGTLSGNENSSLSLAGLTVADSNPGDTLTTVLTVTSGSITAGGQTGATVTLSGTASAINTALSAATYTGNLNFHGADTLSATTTDGGGQTSGLKQFAITVADDATLSVSTSVVGSTGSVVQVGNTLVTSAVITGDLSDLTAPVTYQWQISTDGVHWNNVSASTTGLANGVLSSYYQVSQTDLGDQVRVQAAFTDDTGQTVSATSTPTSAVAEITPILTAPFSYAVDEFKVSDGLGQSFDDTFSNGVPPVGGSFGSNLAAFQTSSGGSVNGGSTWTAGLNSAGQPAAIMSSSGAAYNGTDDSVQATFLTNNQPEGTGTGDSNNGLKENGTFTASGTFDLVVPQFDTSYGIELNEVLPTPGTTTQQVQIQVFGTANGGAQVHLGERDPATGVFTLLASYTLTGAQLNGNNKIELDLVHGTANSTAISGSFELIDNGVQTFSDTFSQTGTSFADSTAVRALIQGISTDGVLITGTAQQGQTLTANTVTNDPNATITYQWMENSGQGGAYQNISGATGATYVAQQTDVGFNIEVVATASDSISLQSVTATSAATGPVAIPLTSQNDEWLNTAGGAWTDSANAATNWSTGTVPGSANPVLIDNSGTYTVTIPTDATANAASLTLDAANATVLDQGTLVLNGGALTVDAGKIVFTNDQALTGGTSFTNQGTVEFATNGISLIDPVTNTGGTLQVDVGNTLGLAGATITGGTINNGTPVTGATVSVLSSSAIESASLNNGAVSIAAGAALTLDGTTVTGATITSLSTTTTTGAINVDSGKTLTLAGTDTLTGGVLAFALGPVQGAGGNSVLFSLVQANDLTPVADPSVTLTIQASSGSFVAISGSGVAITQNGDVVTIVGDLTDVNNALDNGITYTPVGSSNTLTLSVTDGSGDTAFRTISINTSNPASPTTTNLGANGEITNAGLMDITGTTTLSSDSLFNSGGTVKVESSELLKLDDAKVYGGTITDNGTVEVAGFNASPAAPA